MTIAQLQNALTAALHKSLAEMQAYEQNELVAGSTLVRTTAPKLENTVNVRAILAEMSSAGLVLTERVQRKASQLGIEHSSYELAEVSPEASRHARGARLRPFDRRATQLIWDGLADRIYPTVQQALDRPAALLSQQDQVDRIVTTEAWKAYNDARSDVESHLALLRGGNSYGLGRAVDPTDYFPGIVKKWDATLDKRTCPRCSGKDGTILPLGMPFDESLPLHPRCRCALGWWAIPLPNPAR